jgi:hypothetical protein
VNRRALVLEMDSTHVTLLSDDGEFIRLPAGRLPQARYIGQSISMSQIKPKSKMGWMPLLAACIFIALVVIPMVSPPPALAWVSLDNSSSLEVLVDGEFNVREIRPLNNRARIFLEERRGNSKDFDIFVDEFITWSRMNGDNSLLVTATADIRDVTAYFAPYADVYVIPLAVDARVRDEAGKKGLSAGRAIFMAEASECISPETMKEGNPIDALDSAGIDVESFVDGLHENDHEAKIRELPPFNQGKKNENDGLDSTENSDAGQKLPPGLAKKDKKHPAVRSFSRSGSWGKDNRPKGPRGKLEEWSEEEGESPEEEEKEFKHKFKSNKYGDKNANNGNEGKGKEKGNKSNKGKDKGNGNGKNKGQGKGNGKGNGGNKGNKYMNNRNNKGRKGKP